MLARIIEIILWPYTYIKQELRYRKRKRELKKQDPFIYD